MNHHRITTRHYDDELGEHWSITCNCRREFNGYTLLNDALDAHVDHIRAVTKYEQRTEEMSADADSPMGVRGNWNALLRFFGFGARDRGDTAAPRNPAPRWLDRADAPGGD